MEAMALIVPSPPPATIGWQFSLTAHCANATTSAPLSARETRASTPADAKKSERLSRASCLSFVPEEALMMTAGRKAGRGDTGTRGGEEEAGAGGKRQSPRLFTSSCLLLLLSVFLAASPRLRISASLFISDQDQGRNRCHFFPHHVRMIESRSRDSRSLHRMSHAGRTRKMRMRRRPVCSFLARQLRPALSVRPASVVPAAVCLRGQRRTVP